jgi:chemotaxis protein MotB
MMCASSGRIEDALHSRVRAAEGNEQVMNFLKSNRMAVLLFVSALPLSTSCVSNRSYQSALDQKDAELRALREERAELKAQLQSMKSSLDSAHGELSEASARLAEPETQMIPAPDEAAATQRFPELDHVGVSYGMRDGNMVISIPSSITFASGQATLSKEGEKALREVATTLKQQYQGAHYSIEGHTDTDPIKKSKFASNRELSVQRAMAVLTFLVEDCGISDKQCVVAGHGQYTPVAPNDNKDDKSRNRRVEIVVHKQK